jgi:hypothetical protein
MIPFSLPLFFGTLLGKATMAGAIAVAFIGIYWWNALEHQNKGVQKERARVEKQGSKLDAKATSARRAAERAAPDGLREYVRD